MGRIVQIQVQDWTNPGEIVHIFKSSFNKKGRGPWNSTALASLCSSLTNQLTTTIQELGTNQLVKQQTLCVDITV